MLPKRKVGEDIDEFLLAALQHPIMCAEYPMASERYSTCILLASDSSGTAPLDWEAFYAKLTPEQKEIFAVLETVDIGEIDIMGVGKWNGLTFTADELKEVANNFDVLKDKVKVWLSLGHSGKLGTEQRSGMPAVGWFSKIRFDDSRNRLVGYLTDVPKKLAELIRAKAYQTVSAEYIRNFTDETSGKKYNRIAVGVALLGAELPAVTTNRTLDQVRALFSNGDYSHETVEWNTASKGGDKMDELTKLKLELETLAQNLKKAESFILKVCEKFKADQDEVLAAIDNLQKEKNEAINKLEVQAAKVRAEATDNLFTSVSGKLLPKEEEMYRGMLKDSGDKFETKLAELREMFTAKNLLTFKTEEEAEHDPTGRKFESRTNKTEEFAAEADAKSFIEDITHELEGKGIKETISEKQTEAFMSQFKSE